MHIQNHELRLTNRDISAIAARLKKEAGLSHSKTIDAIAGALGFSGGNAMMSQMKSSKTQPLRSHQALMSLPMFQDKPRHDEYAALDKIFDQIQRNYDHAKFMAYLRVHPELHDAVADYLEDRPELSDSTQFIPAHWSLAARALLSDDPHAPEVGASFIGQAHYDALVEMTQRSEDDHQTKTSILEKIAEEQGLDLVDVPMSEADPSDLKGFPGSGWKTDGYKIEIPREELENPDLRGFPKMLGGLEMGTFSPENKPDGFIRFLRSVGEMVLADYFSENHSIIATSVEDEGQLLTPEHWMQAMHMIHMIDFNEPLPPILMKLIAQKIGETHRDALIERAKKT